MQFLHMVLCGSLISIKMNIFIIVILIILIILIFYLIIDILISVHRTKYIGNTQNGRQLYGVINKDTDIISLEPPSTTLHKVIGQGNYGTVHLYVNKKNNSFRWYAVKESRETKSNKEYENSKYLNTQMTSTKSMIAMDAVGYDYRICSIYSVKKDKDKTLVYMQYANGGSLKNFIEKLKKNNKIPKGYMTMIKIIVFNVISAVYALHHEFQLVHLDLKPENVLFLEDPLATADTKEKYLRCANLRLIDFGLSEHITYPPITIYRKGTPLNMPPEVLLYSETKLNPKFDTWAIGCIIYNLITLERLFEEYKTEESLVKAHSHIIRNPDKFSTALESISSDSTLTDLLKCALELDINRRKTVGSLLNHPWFDTVPLSCVPNYLYKYDDVRRLDNNINKTNEFLNKHVILKNKKINASSATIEDIL